MPSESPVPCPARERLENLVQHFLRALSGLAAEELAIVRTGDKHKMLAIDKEIENVIGEKERAMGALLEHRQSHNC